MGEVADELGSFSRKTYDEVATSIHHSTDFSILFIALFDNEAQPISNF
jgi:hypothetical protein